MVRRRKATSSSSRGRGAAKATLRLTSGCGVRASCTKKAATSTAPDSKRPQTTPELSQSSRLP